MEKPYDFDGELTKLASKQEKWQAASDDELSEAANEGHGYIEQIRRYYCDTARSCVVQVLTTGYALQILKGRCKQDRSWVNFLKEKLPGISRATSYRYLELADRYPDPAAVPRNLKLTELYRMSGIIRSESTAVLPTESEKNSQPTKRGSSVCTVKVLCRRIEFMAETSRLYSQQQIRAELSEEELKQLADHLETLQSAVGSLLAALRPKTATGKGNVPPPVSTLMPRRGGQETVLPRPALSPRPPSASPIPPQSSLARRPGR